MMKTRCMMRNKKPSTFDLITLTFSQNCLLDFHNLCDFRHSRKKLTFTTGFILVSSEGT